MLRQIRLVLLVSFGISVADFSVTPSLPSRAITHAQATKKAAEVVEESFKKADLIASISEKSGLTKKDSESALSAIIATIQEQVSLDKKVTLPGLGSFSAKERAARKGRNPQTGETIDIAASKSPSFTAAKPWKDMLKGQKQ
jgi:DNA-binding protein HU-beta